MKCDHVMYKEVLRQIKDGSYKGNKKSENLYKLHCCKTLKNMKGNSLKVLPLSVSYLMLILDVIFRNNSLFRHLLWSVSLTIHRYGKESWSRGDLFGLWTNMSPASTYAKSFIKLPLDEADESSL